MDGSLAQSGSELRYARGIRDESVGCRDDFDAAPQTCSGPRVSHSVVVKHPSRPTLTESPMTHESSMKQVAVSRPKITLLMVLCGVVGLAASGAVGAASSL